MIFEQETELTSFSEELEHSARFHFVSARIFCIEDTDLVETNKETINMLSAKERRQKPFQRKVASSQCCEKV